jgi:hypothetical protein
MIFKRLRISARSSFSGSPLGNFGNGVVIYIFRRFVDLHFKETLISPQLDRYATYSW